MKYVVIFFAILTLTSINANAQIAVIVHKSVKISTANAAQISDFFTMSTREWPDGAKVVVFDQREEVARKKFYNFIGKNPVEVKKNWLRIQLSGDGKAPETLSTDDDVIERISKTPGAISYISADKVTSDVKVIATIN